MADLSSPLASYGVLGATTFRPRGVEEMGFHILGVGKTPTDATAYGIRMTMGTCTAPLVRSTYGLLLQSIGLRRAIRNLRMDLWNWSHATESRTQGDAHNGGLGQRGVDDSFAQTLP
ncbi:MAG: hypothetical protein Ct9H300mP11_33420 [Chloroflexota bacterium]|nr:MAG: hypothetical protein Ct9H300mP11_33420 [Chloroflexota bacterium]